MKNIRYLIVLLAVTLFMPSLPFGINTPVVSAQTTLVRTTLSTAIAGTGTASGTIQVVVASATGMSASTNATLRYILIDYELLRVTAISSTTLTAVRNQGGIATAHPVGAQVIWGPVGNWSALTGNSTGAFLPQTAADPIGTCTAGNNDFMPLVKATTTGVFYYGCDTNSGAGSTSWSKTQVGPVLGEIEPLVYTASDRTATISNDIIGVTSVPANTTRTITLPCSTAPPGKTWKIFDQTGNAGTSGGGISIIGTPHTLQILTGFAARFVFSDGTNCFRVDQ